MKSASLLTVVFLCLAVGIAQGKDAVYGDAVLAIVGDTVITTYDLHLASRQEEIQALRQVPASEYDKTVLKVRDKVLSQLIDRELVFLEFQSLKAQLP
ncbi:MAG: SurA N-terminal domain-containing protein, partial [Victivallales bacterium]|nr:SurA N-terminal domain-containing protein [Victivallales bacterium]